MKKRSSDRDCQHCGEPMPFRWMGGYHCREDQTLAGLAWPPAEEWNWTSLG